MYSTAWSRMWSEISGQSSWISKFDGVCSIHVPLLPWWTAPMSKKTRSRVSSIQIWRCWIIRTFRFKFSLSSPADRITPIGPHSQDNSPGMSECGLQKEMIEAVSSVSGLQLNTYCIWYERQKSPWRNATRPKLTENLLHPKPTCSTLLECKTYINTPRLHEKWIIENASSKMKSTVGQNRAYLHICASFQMQTDGSTRKVEELSDYWVCRSKIVFVQSSGLQNNIWLTLPSHFSKIVGVLTTTTREGDDRRW